MADLGVRVNITGNSRDLIGSVAAAKAALRSLRTELRGNTQLTRDQVIHNRDLNRALRDQSRLAQSLVGDYVALRRAVLTLAVRTAVTGFGALASSMQAAAGAAGLLALSLGRVGAAVGAVSAASLAGAIQGFGVLKLAVEGLGEALTTTGKDHEKALEKLTKPARAFVGEMRGVQMAFREIKLLSQEGLFPGLTRGVNRAKAVLEPIKQAVYDTARAWGYLAEQAGGIIGGRTKTINSLLQRNVITFRRLGDTAINFGSAFMTIWKEAGPLVGRFTRDLVTLSKRFRSFINSEDGKKGLRTFFKDLRDSYIAWRDGIGGVGKFLANTFSAARGPLKDFEDAVSKAFVDLGDWSATKGGKQSIKKFFEEALPVASEMAKTTGAVFVSLRRIAGEGQSNAIRFWKGMRTDVLPILEEVFTFLNNHIFPKVMDVGGAFADLIKELIPGFEALAPVLSIIADAAQEFLETLKDIMSFANELGSFASAIAALGITAAVLSSWRSFKDMLKLSGVYMRQLTGGVDPGTVTRQDFRRALPWYIGGPMRTGGVVGRRIKGRYYQSEPLGRHIIEPSTKHMIHTEYVGRAVKYGQASILGYNPLLHMPVASSAGLHRGYAHRPAGGAAPFVPKIPGTLYFDPRTGRVHQVGGGMVKTPPHLVPERFMRQRTTRLPFHSLDPNLVMPPGYGLTPRRIIGTAGLEGPGKLSHIGQVIARDPKRAYRHILRFSGRTSLPFGLDQIGDMDPKEVRRRLSHWSQTMLREHRQVLRPVSMSAPGQRSVAPGGKHHPGANLLALAERDVRNNMVRGTREGGIAGMKAAAKQFPTIVSQAVTRGFARVKVGGGEGGGGGQRGGVTGFLGNIFGKGGALRSFGGMMGSSLAMMAAFDLILGDGQMIKGAGRGLGSTFMNIARPRTDQFKLPKHGFLEGSGFGKFFGRSNDLKKFGDDAEGMLKKLSKANNFQGLKRLGDQAEDLARKFPKSRKELEEFTREVRRAQKRAWEASTGVGDAFDRMRSSSGFSLEAIRDTVRETTETIKYRLGTDSAKGKEALSHNFELAAKAIDTSIDRGVVSLDEGLAEIRKLMREELKLYGVTDMRVTKPSRSERSGQREQLGGFAGARNRGAATGGMFTVGKAGAKGRDTVPAMLNGQPAVVAEGEDVAVVNRHQRAYLDARLADVGGFAGVFKHIRRPHYMSVGGIVGLGRRLQSEGYHVSEHPAFGGVGRHSPNSYHYRGQAIDVNADHWPGGEAPALDRLHARLKGMPGIVELLWRVADHFDHLHVAMAGKGGKLRGLGAGRIPDIDILGNDGVLGRLLNLGVNRARDAANDQLSKLIGSQALGGHTGGGASGGMSKSAIKSLWVQAGGDPARANLMAAIALAESSGNPAANGPPDGRGLWQVEWPIWGRKMSSLGFGNPYDPLENAKMARHILNVQGLGAWVVYKTGAYRKFLAKGGLIEAATGLPPRDDGYPDVNTDDAITGGSGGSSKKRTTRRARRPRRRLPYGLSLLGRRRKMSRKRMRKMARDEINRLKGKVQAPFEVEDMFLKRDPITGELIGVESLSMVKPLTDGQRHIAEVLTPFIEQMQFEHGRVTEQDTVTLEDTHQYKDLTNWLRSNSHLIPSGWTVPEVVNELGSVTVDNTRQKFGGPYQPMWGDGLTVQGQHIPGIGQALVKTQDQMRAHGRVLSSAQNQLLYILFGIGGKPDKAIKERRERLLMIKGMVERRITRKKKIDAKIRDARKRNFTWRQAVNANQDLISEWRKSKRDSKNLPRSEVLFINGIIDHLTQTNRRLRRAKPKGTAAQGQHLRELYYQRYATNESLRYLQGTAESQWQQPPRGGRAWPIYNSMQGWQEVKDYAVEAAGNLKPIKTEQEQAIKALGDQYKEWSGRRVNVANLLATAKEQRDKADRAARDAELKNLKEQENEQLRMQMTHMRAQFDALKGFMPMLAGRQIGSFARGGVIPETGMALVHKGEFINPAPDGPFRTGMNAAPEVSSGPTQIILHVDGDLAALIRRVDARVDGRAAQVVSQAIGQRSRGIHAAPGGRR